MNICDSILQCFKASQDSDFVLAVDARPLGVGGFLKNNSKKTVIYYSMTESQRPYSLKDTSREGNSAEFEMKNLLHALFIWSHHLKSSKVEIYTDNTAIRTQGVCSFGRVVQGFIDHLGKCLGVKVTNEAGMYVDSAVDRDVFRNVILPADYLSRGDIFTFQSCLKENIGNKYKFTEDGANFTDAESLKNFRCGKCGFQMPGDLF